MSQYFAQVTNGVVTDVRVVSAEFMATNPDRYPGIWVETFIGLPNKTYAGIGYTYDADSGDFVAPEVFEVPLP